MRKTVTRRQPAPPPPRSDRGEEEDVSLSLPIPPVSTTTRSRTLNRHSTSPRSPPNGVIDETQNICSDTIKGADSDAREGSTANTKGTASVAPAKNKAAKKKVSDMTDVDTAIWAIQADVPTHLPPPVPEYASGNNASSVELIGGVKSKPAKPTKPIRSPSPTSARSPGFRNDRDAIALQILQGGNDSTAAEDATLLHDNAKEAEASGDTRTADYENDTALRQSSLHANPIYDYHTMNSKWLYAAVAAHVVQFTLLLTVARKSIRQSVLVALVFLAFLVAALLLGSRYYVHKHKSSSLKAGGKGESAANPHRGYAHTVVTYTFSGSTSAQRTPADEADDIDPKAVYMIAAASVVEGMLFSAFTAAVVNTEESFDSTSGFQSQVVLLQILQFASITFLLFHQVVRPSNRCDPLRTMLELEVVSVCWDALDGATIYELLYDLEISGNLTPSMDGALRALLAFWYLSVGCRTAVMQLCHLPSDTWGYKWLLPPPLSLAKEPVVDRTLQALRNRSIVMLTMASAEMYGGICRIVLWSRGQLNQLQMEMAIKNMAFLYSVYSASDMWSTTKRRDWNTKEIGCGLEFPERLTQLSFFKWLFIIAYIGQGAMMSLVLSNVTPSSQAYRWQANTGFDLILAYLFWLYCSNCENKRRNNEQGRFIMYPQTSHVIFPKKMALIVTSLMFTNLFIARIPALYEAYGTGSYETSGLYTYSMALMLVAFSIITIGACAWYWSLSYMLFNREFTAAPGNYNAIHDPTIIMVSTTAQIEGAMDVLSTVMLMQLAQENITKSLGFSSLMTRFIQCFVLLELLNAGMCFLLQVFLAGGTDDTPMHLVKWKALLRSFRAGIDVGVLTLRMVLWVKYGALSSVFLIKNLYNLVHTAAQIERYIGVEKYPKYTVFTEAVAPADWYGLSKTEWRDATGSTIALQAQSGRAV